MTPFVAWSRSRTEMPVLAGMIDGHAFQVELRTQTQDEISMLIEDMIENLISSSAVKLKNAFELMQQSCEEQRQKDQDARILQEISKIERMTTAIVADALVPVLSDLQRSRVVNEFASLLKKILPEFAQQSLTINAPDAVRDELSEALRRHSVEADVLLSDRDEIVVSGNTVVLRADLDQWARQLREVAAV